MKNLNYAINHPLIFEIPLIHFSNKHVHGSIALKNLTARSEPSNYCPLINYALFFLEEY
jgi:hypothetical protein